MSHIELPGFVVSTELGRLSEEFFNLGEVLTIPIDFSLSHKHRYILFQTLIELFQALLNPIVVVFESGILYTFRDFPESVNMLIGQTVKPSISFFWRGILHNESIDIFEVLVINTFKSQVSILSQHISSQVIILVFTIQKQQVRESFRRKRRVLQKEVELLKAFRRTIFDIHKSHIHKRDWVQFLFRPRRHI